MNFDALCRNGEEPAVPNITWVCWPTSLNVDPLCTHNGFTPKCVLLRGRLAAVLGDCSCRLAHICTSSSTQLFSAVTSHPGPILPRTLPLGPDPRDLSRKLRTKVPRPSPKAQGSDNSRILPAWEQSFQFTNYYFCITLPPIESFPSVLSHKLF